MIPIQTMVEENGTKRRGVVCPPNERLFGDHSDNENLALVVFAGSFRAEQVPEKQLTVIGPENAAAQKRFCDHSDGKKRCVFYDEPAGAPACLRHGARHWEALHAPGIGRVPKELYPNCQLQTFRIIRLAEDYGVAVVVTPAETDPKNQADLASAKFYLHNDCIEQKEFFEEISCSGAISYFGGIADGLGFGEKPDRDFSSLAEAQAWLEQSNEACNRQRLEEFELKEYGRILSPDERLIEDLDIYYLADMPAEEEQELILSISQTLERLSAENAPLLGKLKSALEHLVGAEALQSHGEFVASLRQLLEQYP